MMTITGYRQTDRPLLSGHWLRGELLGVPDPDAPVLTLPASIEPKNVYVVRDTAVVHFAELDWVHRRARLEIGLRPGTHDLAEVVRLAVRHGFVVLNLRRLYGWVTPAVATPTEPLEAAGFVRETLVPQAIWHAGGPVDRQQWGVLRDD
ncbi:GNAT family N-acetyltransferase [Actinophytocola oryzae]|uniref:Uncharacterized protein n=1 Tax=Actinophytocola oryzae TaxID=502181 RepID=A0A4R7VXG2_9PSEU|nr:hypothetical protein [Actinophytocola oryzae]TDV54813.1 hypothetical protein CLV71_10353 [Actinophytocola oryzae]